MKAVNRRNKIKELIDSTNKVQVSDLAESFNVSMETIRRDLDIYGKGHACAMLLSREKFPRFRRARSRVLPCGHR